MPRRTPRALRTRSPRVGGVVLVLVLLASLLGLAVPATATPVAPVASTAAAAAAAADPSADRPHLPRRCIQPGETVPTKAGPCYVSRFVKTRPTIVMWGDSHAWQHLPSTRVLARENNLNLVIFFIGSCPPILWTSPKGPTCERSNYEALKFVRDLKATGRPFRVLLGGFWQAYREVYRDVYVTGVREESDFNDAQLTAAKLFHARVAPLFSALGRARIPVDVIGQSVRVPEDPKFCAGGAPFSCAIPRRAALPDEIATRRWLRARMDRLAGSPRLIRFNGAYCSRTLCQGRQGGIYTFFDEIHLSATRAATLKPAFAATVRRLR